MEQKKIDYADVYLQTLLICWNLQENIDLLKGSNVYRHDLKQAANRLAGMLEKIINTDMNDICGIQDDALYAQMDYHRNLIRQVSAVRADENGIIALIIEEYLKKPEAVLEALKIQVVDKIPVEHG